MIDIKKVIEDMNSELSQKKRELWWALHDNDMEAFERISAEIDDMKNEKEKKYGPEKSVSESSQK